MLHVIVQKHTWLYDVLYCLNVVMVYFICLSVQAAHRKPPPVVPYSRHVEGKKKLVESLDAMYHDNEGTSKRFSAEVPIGVLLSFSPPDTPPNDHSESASLCSKDSIEVSQTEVVTANLVDLGPEVKLEEEGVDRQASFPKEDETESESVISSDSSRASPSLVWADSRVLQNHHAESPPPIPPPRSKRQNKPAGQLSSAEEHKLQPFLHPPQFGPRPSPFDDFSSSIAATLIHNSKRYSDPQAANTLSGTGMDLFKALDGAISREHSTPPVCSKGTPTTDPSISEANERPSSAPPPSSSSYPLTNDPWKPLPQQTPLLQSQRAKRLPPPIKPQPYGGSGAKAFLQPNSSTAHSSDPFSELDLFGAQGMQGYAKSAASEPSGSS